jgi:hypothetical protein
VKQLVANFGTLDFASNEEIEAGDLEEIARTKGGNQPVSRHLNSVAP